jgi:hypothetical protein
MFQVLSGAFAHSPGARSCACVLLAPFPEKEDASQLPNNTSPQVAATLRNAAIAALRLAGFTSMAAGRRWAARVPARPLAVMNLI